MATFPRPTFAADMQAAVDAKPGDVWERRTESRRAACVKVVENFRFNITILHPTADRQVRMSHARFIEQYRPWV